MRLIIRNMFTIKLIIAKNKEKYSKVKAQMEALSQEDLCFFLFFWKALYCKITRQKLKNKNFINIQVIIVVVKEHVYVVV